MKKKVFYLTILLILYNLNPLFSQTNWELLNPKPSSSNGKKIEFVTKNRGYILTSDELLETLDNGFTWVKKIDIESGNDISFKDGIGFIVGDYGYILKSIDNGLTWKQIKNNYTISFNKINIFDAYSIILCGSNKFIKTNDGGIGWTLYNIPNVSVEKTVFTSDLVGYAFCDGIILKTINGGLNWYTTYETTITPSNFMAVHFVNENVGYASRAHRYIFKTIDGGETWVEIKNTDFAIYDFYFLDEKIGFATGEYGFTYKTIDGGETWNNISFENLAYASNTMYSIYFQDNNNGLLTGMEGKIYKTTDGGSTWNKNSFTYDGFSKIKIINDKVGYAKTINSFYKTTDFGNTWKSLDSKNLGTDILKSINNFTFINENIGFASTGGTNSGSVYKTTDGGNSWVILNSDNRLIDEGITSICFLDSNIGFISGGFNYRKTLKTNDGGLTWSQVSDQTMYNIQFLNYDVGYARGYSSVYKTTDGGKTWDIIFELQNLKEIKSINFVDENNGFLVGGTATAYKTNDGGSSWEKVNVPYMDFVFTKFYTSETGYILDYYGFIYKTENGGISWNQNLCKSTIGTIELADNYIFVAGSGGKIYRSYTGLLNTNNVQLQKHVTIYPNPANDILNISAENETFTNAKIYDFLGRCILSQQLVNNNINVSTLPSGSYFLEIQNTKSEKFKKQFIKN